MSEFVQTMKDWHRMCQHMEKIGGYRSCDICPLGGCNAIYEDDGDTDYAKIGEKVAAWAAEHPEPVYPTFAEWLCSIGVTISDRPFPSPNIPVYVFQVNAKMFEPIPHDLAQKLEIEPLPKA